MMARIAFSPTPLTALNPNRMCPPLASRFLIVGVHHGEVDFRQIDIGRFDVDAAVPSGRSTRRHVVHVLNDLVGVD